MVRKKVGKRADEGGRRGLEASWLQELPTC